jgi:hypothetical protein
MAAEHKILNTQQVLEMAAAAIDHDFNRQLPTEVMLKLDVDKYHIAVPRLFDHTRNREGDPMHHRVELLLGLKDRREPARVYLDIADEDWAGFPSAEEVLERVRAEGT